MSKLEQLISELCPDGIERRRLDDVIISLKTGLNPRKNFVLNTDDAENYYVTVREIVNGKIVFCDKTDRVNNDALALINNRSNLEVGDVLFSGTGTVGKIAVIEEHPTNWNIKEGVYVIKPNPKFIISKYLAYVLGSSTIIGIYSLKIVGSPVCSLPMADLRKLIVPLPPLPIQREIVKILDNLSEHTEGLTAELTAELTARKKQYEYYRNELLTFGSTVSMVTLGDVSSIYDGTHKTPTYTNEGIRFVSVENIYALKQSKKCISAQDYERLYKVKPRKNDVFMTRIGSIGACAVVEDDEPLAYYVTLTLIRPNQERLNSRFLKHAIESIHGKNELWKRTLIHATPIKINLGEIGKISIPLPSLEEQARIVDILDKFDALTINISNSLSAEIEVRNKQYEYYHDNLLAFKELEV